MNFKNLTWGQMGKVQPPQKDIYSDLSVYTSLQSLNTILRNLYAKIDKLPSGRFRGKLTFKFFKIEIYFLKIQNLKFYKNEKKI